MRGRWPNGWRWWRTSNAEAATGGWDVPLANLRIHVQQDAAAATPTLTTLTLENRDGAHYTLDNRPVIPSFRQRSYGPLGPVFISGSA